MLLEQDKLLWANSWSGHGQRPGVSAAGRPGAQGQPGLARRRPHRQARLVGGAGQGRHPQPAPTRSTTCCRPIRRGTSTTCRAAPLELNRGGIDISLAELQALVAQAPAADRQRQEARVATAAGARPAAADAAAAAADPAPARRRQAAPAPAARRGASWPTATASAGTTSPCCPSITTASASRSTRPSAWCARSATSPKSSRATQPPKPRRSTR